MERLDLFKKIIKFQGNFSYSATREVLAHSDQCSVFIVFCETLFLIKWHDFPGEITSQSLSNICLELRAELKTQIGL